MYSYELDNVFKEHNYRLSFFEFNNLVINSPQVLYNINWGNDIETCLNVWTSDNYHWEIIVPLKQQWEAN